MKDPTLALNRPTSSQLRVAFLSWRDIKHPEAGGAEIFLEQVSAGLAARGHRVTVVTARYPGSVAMEARDDRIFFRHGGRLGVYPSGFAHVLRRQRAYDVIVDIQNGVPFWSPLATRTPVLNLVHHVHREQWSQVLGAKQSALGWWLESTASPRVYRKAEFLAVSQATRHELIDLGIAPDRIRVVYSGVDPLPEPHVPVPRPPGPALVVLGRLVPHKRVEQAIDTVAALREEFPDIHLTVAGHGYWEPRLRAHAHAAGVSDCVRFAGVVSEQEKADILAAADLHLLPSVKEGWGLVIIEAGLMGTPSVAYYSAGGTQESIVDGTTGVLVADEAGFQNAVRDLLRDPARLAAMSSAARDFAQQFSWDRSVVEVEAALLASADLRR